MGSIKAEGNKNLEIGRDGEGNPTIVYGDVELKGTGGLIIETDVYILGNVLYDGSSFCSISDDLSDGDPTNGEIFGEVTDKTAPRMSITDCRPD